jgi:hypothetical protein
MSGAEQTDALFCEMVERTDSMRLARLARQYYRAGEGYSYCEVAMAMCFHLHQMVSELPIEARASLLSVMIRMIDPAKGDG